MRQSSEILDSKPKNEYRNATIIGTLAFICIAQFGISEKNALAAPGVDDQQQVEDATNDGGRFDLIVNNLKSAFEMKSTVVDESKQNQTVETAGSEDSSSFLGNIKNVFATKEEVQKQPEQQDDNTKADNPSIFSSIIDIVMETKNTTVEVENSQLAETNAASVNDEHQAAREKTEEEIKDDKLTELLEKGDNESFLWHYFTSNGYSPIATAAILGSVDRESGYKSHDSQIRYINGIAFGGLGFFQYNGGRRKSVMEMFPNSYETPKSQAEYARYELEQGRYKDVKNDLQEANDLAEAVEIFQNRYEKCHIDHCNFALRLASAEKVYNKYTNDSSNLLSMY